ncbi:MAG: hypothetical protein M0Z59_01015 [Nitrospiraceae bacterium]|nr:hypothetical protein [Nitrospiraceae bacterium]
MVHHFFDADSLQSLFDTVPSFLFIVDPDVRIHHLNASALSLLDTGPGEHAGIDLHVGTDEMQGSVEITSEEGKGTIVSLFLPVCSPAEYLN